MRLIDFLPAFVKADRAGLKTFDFHCNCDECDRLTELLRIMSKEGQVSAWISGGTVFSIVIRAPAASLLRAGRRNSGEALRDYIRPQPMHDGMRELAQNVFDRRGIRVLRADFDWRSLDNMGAPPTQLVSVRLDTEKGVR